MDEPDNWELDSQLRTALGSPNKPDFDAWRHRHPNAIDQLKSTATKLVRRRTLLWRCANVTTAAIVVVVGFYVFMVPPQPSYAQAFHRFSRVLIAAKSVRYQSEMTVYDQSAETVVWSFLSPGKYRVEGAKFFTVIDETAGKQLLVNLVLKRATLFKFKGSSTQSRELEHFERLRKLLAHSEDAKDGDFQSLGEQVIDGQRAIGFRLDHPLAIVTLWGNPRTGLPLRIETKWHDASQLDQILTNFQINLDLADSLFDLTPPAGFTMLSIDYHETEICEDDLLAALKFTSDLNDGEFPVTIDQIGLESMTNKYLAPRLKEKRDDNAEVERLLKDLAPLVRGYQFAMEELTESADAHYAGQGITVGTADMPIFWYKPLGSATYRVIDATLKVTESKNAPDVVGAKRLKHSSSTSNKRN
ncbi:MAG: hypothetical protein JSS49_20305 [Planctomycetes bacterium]|nr:hypothetical protein [Planctomycetota bacterium]